MMQGFWDYQYKKENKDILANTSGEEIWRRLELQPYIKAGVHVLEIGIGLGRNVKDMTEKQMNVYACDISQTALDRVSSSVKGSYLSRDLDKIPSEAFDLAVSFLVTQHIDEEDLRVQLKEVIRALKPTGIFAMQFAYLLTPRCYKVQIIELMQSGGVCWSLGEMDKLVHESGGCIVHAKRLETFPRWNSGWYGIHIMRGS